MHRVLTPDSCIFQNIHNRARLGIFRNKILVHPPNNIEENWIPIPNHFLGLIWKSWINQQEFVFQNFSLQGGDSETDFWKTHLIFYSQVHPYLNQLIWCNTFHFEPIQSTFTQ